MLALRVEVVEARLAVKAPAEDVDVPVPGEVEVLHARELAVIAQPVYAARGVAHEQYIVGRGGVYPPPGVYGEVFNGEIAPAAAGVAVDERARGLAAVGV